MNIKDIIPGSINNYKQYFNLILLDFEKKWLIAILILVISFIATNIIKTKRNKIVGIIYSLITVILLTIFSFGLYPFIKQPLFVPRAMYGIGITISIISLLAVDYKKAYIPKICIFYLAYAFFVLTLTYGNALDEQKRYTQYRIGLVATDLNNIDVDNEKTLYINVKGSIGRPNNINNLVKEYKVLDRLLPETFGDDSWNWANQYFYNYYNLPNIKRSLKRLDIETIELYKNTRYHDIYKNEDKLIIVLKDN